MAEQARIQAAATHATDGEQDKRKKRRVRLLKRILSGDTKGATIRRATTLEDLREAYRVTHDSFVEQGYIQPDPTGLRLRPCEALPQTATFIAELDGRIVAVTTGVVDSELIGVPSDKAFKPEIDRLRARGRLVGEGTNWLALPEARNCGIFSELIRASTGYGITQGCDDVIGSVSPGHSGFYESIGWHVLGAERSYCDDHDDPVVLVGMDMDLENSIRGDARDFLMSYWWTDNPYRRKMSEWSEEAEAEFRNPELLCRLFVTEGQLLQRCSAMELEGIRRAWGVDLFDEVMRLAAPRRRPAWREPAVQH